MAPFLLAVFPGLVATPSRAATLDAGAVVLVNSDSARYSDFQRCLQPYLDNFGVPYTVLNIATNAPAPDIGNYALIIVGHAELDTNLVHLNSSAESSIRDAVTNGTGLVNFDNLLSINGTNLYPFVQDIFGFNYGPSFSATNVAFPSNPPAPHYITSRHPAGESIGFKTNILLPGILLPTNAQALALSANQPFVSVLRYGSGRVVQWTSYDWTATAVKGPVAGLDDLVWRSFVWSARKPFVMRGLPNFVTMRVDDVEGPLYWASIANEYGFKPWLGLFFSCVDATGSSNELRTLALATNVTASVHSFGCAVGEWFYWNYYGATNWSNNKMSNHFAQATQWHLNHGFPISKVVVPHYAEIGPNAFAHLQSWGVEYVCLRNAPGTDITAPWVMEGPYRLYETPGAANSKIPVAYADFITVPGYPELDGKFFNCVTEIRDDTPSSEWSPDNNVAASIGRGSRQLRRAMDSMVLGTLFTHEWYIHPTADRHDLPAITTNNWRAILQGITNAVASYNPIYVTLDYACQYVRATRTSRIAESSYETTQGRLTATLSGKADLETKICYYTGEDDAIQATAAVVPAFAAGSTNTLLVVWPHLSVTMTATNMVLVSWPGPAPGLQLQVSAALGLAAWADVTNVPSVTGEKNQVILPYTNASRFYRLVHP